MSILNRLFKGQRVGLPKIGCGLAGGDWNVVEFIMAEELTDVDLTIMWI
jgi:O-acetyl-ADP-ribose deacetylase (regulator of RNase III)